jgi:hypothetical protein
MAEYAKNVSDIEESRDKGSFWRTELAAAKKTLDKFHKQGAKVVSRYLDERSEFQDSFKLNLFHSNVQTLQDTMYDSLPKVETSRRNADSGDDIARVAASILYDLPQGSLDLLRLSRAKQYFSLCLQLVSHSLRQSVYRRVHRRSTRARK